MYQLDEEFFGSQRDPHSYTQTMMRGIMSDNSLDDITDTIEEITRTVEYRKDELS